MAVTINGDGTISGVSVGGLPTGSVTADTLATNSVNSAELIDGAVDNSHLATGIDVTKLADGTITNSELQYINSLSSNAQTQISGASTLAPYYVATGNNEVVSDDVITKLAIQFDSQDSDACFEGSPNYRFTPSKAGRYFFAVNVWFDGWGADKFHNAYLYLYKNGASQYSISEDDYNNYTSYSKAISYSTIITMNGSTDYLETYARLNVTTGSGKITGQSLAFFLGA